MPFNIPELHDSGVPREAGAEIVRLYRRAGREMKKMVMRPPGGTEKAIAFRRARAADLSRQIDAMLADLGKRTNRWIKANAREAYRTGIAAGIRQARAAGVTGEGSAFRGSFSVIDRRSVEVFAADIAADLQQSREAMGKRAKSLLRKTASIKLATSGEEIALTEVDIDRILAGGVIEGAPTKAIAELRGELAAQAGETVSIIGKGGTVRDFEVGYYADLVVRTKTREATVKARHNRLGELGLDLVVIVGRTSENFCTAFLGQAFSLSGKSRKYPAYGGLPGGGPPFHPNCSKSTRPFIDELADAGQRRNARGLKASREMLAKSTAEAQRLFKQRAVRERVEARYQTKKGVVTNDA